MPTNKKLVEDDRLTQADSTNADERPCDRYEEERESCDQGEAFPDNVADECRVPYAEEAAEPSEPPHDGEAADPSDAASAADCADAANNHTPNMHNKDLGKRGEDAAAAFLERRGFDVLHRNWVCAAGEADIIALDDDALHFVEVKTRMSDRNGFPPKRSMPTSASAMSASPKSIWPPMRALIRL